MTPPDSSPVVGYLSVQLLLRGDAVISGTPEPGRHNTVTTIPGRTLQGMFAALCPPADVVDLAVSGRRLTFGPAVPAVSDEDEQVIPATPAPLSWFRSHEPGWDETQPVHDLLTGTDDLPLDGRPQQIRGYLTGVTDDTTTQVVVASRSQLHQQRDRRRGRPVQSTGGPFEMVTLARGQVFVTRWRLAADNLAALTDLTDRVLAVLRSGPASIGTAKDSRYGGALTITALPAIDPTPADARLEQLPYPGPVPGPWPSGEHRDVLLLAPTLFVDPATGAISPTAAGAAVAAHYGPVDHVDSWVGAHPYSGYHSLYRGYLPSETAAAAGTIVRLRARQDIPADFLLARVTSPLGVRTTEGLGAHRILRAEPPGWLDPTTRGAAVTDLPALADTPAGHVQLGDGTTAAVPTVHLPVDPARDQDPGVRQLHLLQHRLLQEAAERGVDDLARSLTTAPKGPSRHLWGRLNDLLSEGDDWERGRRRLAGAVADHNDQPPGSTLTPATQKLLSASWRPHRHYSSTRPGGQTTVLLFLREGSSSDSQVLAEWWTSNLSADARRHFDDGLAGVVLTGWRRGNGHQADPADVVADWRERHLPRLSWLLLVRWLTFGRRGTSTRTENTPT